MKLKLIVPAQMRDSSRSGGGQAEGPLRGRDTSRNDADKAGTSEGGSKAAPGEI